jgi:hypothetical protein
LARNNAEKAHAFAKHLAQVFQPHPTENEPEEKETYTKLLEIPTNSNHQSAALKEQSPSSHQEAKFEEITSKILKVLRIIGIKYITQLFNSILLKRFFPSQWKVTQIILSPKPEKQPNELTSYRPMSFLSITSEVFEKLILKRILPLVEDDSLISNHQFGFRQRHSTIEQTPDCAKDKRSSRKQTLLLSSIRRYLTSIQQIMAFRTTVHH